MPRATPRRRRPLFAARSRVLVALVVTMTSSLVVLGPSPASAAVSPSSLEFGDVPWGTSPETGPRLKVSITDANTIKGVGDTARFKIVDSTCGDWQTPACEIWVAPQYPSPGASQPGRETQWLQVSYTDGTIERIYASANFLPEPADPPPSSWLTVRDVAVAEGTGGTRAATFTIVRSGSVAAPASVKWATENGTAHAGSDYVSVPATTVGFAAGKRFMTVSVTVNRDALAEPDETFSVRLTSPTGAVIADEVAIGTIVDDDRQAYLSVTDISVAEGGIGAMRTATFTVTRSGNVAGTSSVRWHTVNGTATAGSDFVAVAPTVLTFAPGQTARTISATVNGDALDERDETFSVRLSSPTAATVSDDAGTATIEDDDASYLSVNDVSVMEGQSGTRQATFTLSRSGSAAGPSSAAWATLNGTATAGSDYVAVASTPVIFAAGERLKTLAVAIVGETLDEENETFSVRVSSPSGAEISDGLGVATIVDDDGPVTAGPSTFITVNDRSVGEGNSGSKTVTFTVTRRGSTAGTSSARWRTVDGTATAGTDYTAVPLTMVSFAAGERTKVFAVTVAGDAVDEANETFSVRLSEPVGASFSDAVGIATIEDDDASYLSVGDISLTEGSSGNRAASFTIRRRGGAAAASTVRWATGTGSADAGGDYVSVPPTTLTFAPTQRTKTVSVSVVGDVHDEPRETFRVVLSGAVGAVVSDGSATATITDDDAPTYLRIDDVRVAETDTGTRSATFTISRLGNTQGTSSVRWNTGGGTAAAGTDYVAVPATTVSFAAGQASRALSVTVNGDTVDEGHETFGVSLSAATGATLSDASAIATIVDDDPTTGLVVNDVLAVNEELAHEMGAQFTITRSGQLSGTSSVQFSTSDGTATAGSDYVGVLEVVTFAAGQRFARVLVTILDDAVDEEHETFSVALSSPDGATIVDGAGTARIADDGVDPDPV